MNKSDLRNELNKFDNLFDMLNFLMKKFDLTMKLSTITKPLVIEGLLKAFDLTRPKLK